MKKGKLPYFCWYPADFDGDENVRLMNIEEIGLYAVCLNHCWINGSLPADPLEISRAMKVPKAQFLRAWPRVLPCFQQNIHGRWTNPRQERERSVAAEAQDRKRKGGEMTAAKRWGSDKPSDKPSDSLATIRAYDSGSVYDSVASSEKEKVAIQNFERALQESSGLAEICEELKELYIQAGVPLAPKHEQTALQYLLQIEPSKVSQVPRYVRHMLKSGRWGSARTTKGLLNLLRDGDWDVPIVERTIPAPRDTSHETAQQRKLRAIEEA